MMKTAPWALALAIVMTAGVAQADPDELGAGHVHNIPPEYLDPEITAPPASGQAPDYPLAVAFTPAHSSNYTPGGISSYEYVVVHTMQGYYGGSISWFQNPDSNVSAHYCMRAEDGEITQMVRNTDRAWHVGSSNPLALGIEHEGFVDDASWYTWANYVSSARLARWLCDTYEIPVDRDHIVGHVELPSQTHTDPGSNWNWDLYMALVRDVVPAGEIHGVVVDASAPCSITAASDTWLKATLEDSDALAEEDKCFVPAGTELSAAHMSEDMVGHRRVTLQPTGLCPGALDTEAFVFTDHLSATCATVDVGVPGAQVVLGEIGVATEADGTFVLAGVAEGDHLLEITADGFEDDAAPVGIAVYPGARIVVAITPIASGDTGADDSGGSTDDGEPGGDSGPQDPGEDDGGDEDDGGETGDSGPSDPPQALPDTHGGDGTAANGCSCRASRSGTGWLGALVLLAIGAGSRRRRRGHAAAVGS